MYSGIVLYEIRKIDLRESIIPLLAISLLFYFLQFPFWQLLGGIALFAIGINLKLKPHKLWRRVRSQSVWIFYCHMIIIFFLTVLFPSFCKTNPFFFAISILTLSVCLALLLDILSEKKKFRFLKFLI